MVNKKAFPKVAKAIRFTKEELEFLATVNHNMTRAVQHCIRAAMRERDYVAPLPAGDGGAGKTADDPF